MKKVIVVGGGVAGLTAGRRLVDSGKFEVKLLEGDVRVGGRVHTRPFGDHFIENGAQWVHGEEGNAIFKLASSFNLLDPEEDDNKEGNKDEDVDESGKAKFLSDSLFITNKGRILEPKIHEKVSLVLGEVLEGPEEDEWEGSVGEWAIKYFEKEVDGPLDPNCMRLNSAVIDWIHRFQDNIDGSDNWYNVSVKGQHEYHECEGNSTVAWKSPACYSSLLGLILNGSPNKAPTFQPELPSWIETGKEVNKIEVGQSAEGPNSISVRCSDGTQYHCDFVICTVSLGVLKHSHKSLFRPVLPEEKVLAIENLGIGCVNKLHFDFKKRWWPDHVEGFNLLFEDCDEVDQYWRSDIAEATLKKEIDGFPLWTRNILGFYLVSSHPTALNSWITGPAAKLIESMTDEEVKAMFMKVLRFFLKNTYDIPDPAEFCRSSWGTNRFTRGSYSFRQMESERKNVWAKHLAEPVLDKSNLPVICFAGEATHDHFYSTVHGAYETGIREADRLINLLSHLPPK